MNRPGYFLHPATCRAWSCTVAAIVLGVTLGACSSKTEESASSVAPASAQRNSADSPVRAVNQNMAGKATFGGKAEAVKRRTR